MRGEGEAYRSDVELGGDGVGGLVWVVSEVLVLGLGAGDPSHRRILSLSRL